MEEKKATSQTINLSQDEIVMGFVALCIENCAEKEGVPPRTMYQRMSKVGLIQSYLIGCYDTLHTESIQSVTNLVLNTLKGKESKV